jgi:hypothetical protein
MASGTMFLPKSCLEFSSGGIFDEQLFEQLGLKT